MESSPSVEEACESSDVRTVAATRNVAPLRQGGSLPALVEADDDGYYVVKLRGAGQGPKALVLELVRKGGVGGGCPRRYARPLVRTPRDRADVSVTATSRHF